MAERKELGVPRVTQGDGVDFFRGRGIRLLGQHRRAAVALAVAAAGRLRPAPHARVSSETAGRHRLLRPARVFPGPYRAGLEFGSSRSEDGARAPHRHHRGAHRGHGDLVRTRRPRGDVCGERPGRPLGAIPAGKDRCPHRPARLLAALHHAAGGDGRLGHSGQGGPAAGDSRHGRRCLEFPDGLRAPSRRVFHGFAGAGLHPYVHGLGRDRGRPDRLGLSHQGVRPGLGQPVTLASEPQQLGRALAIAVGRPRQPEGQRLDPAPAASSVVAVLLGTK